MADDRRIVLAAIDGRLPLKIEQLAALRMAIECMNVAGHTLTYPRIRQFVYMISDIRFTYICAKILFMITKQLLHLLQCL